MPVQVAVTEQLTSSSGAADEPVGSSPLSNALLTRATGRTLHLKLHAGRHVTATTITVDGRVEATELHVSPASSASSRASEIASRASEIGTESAVDAPIMQVLEGAPPVHLHGLVLRGPIHVHGGQLTLTNCTLTVARRSTAADAQGSAADAQGSSSAGANASAMNVGQMDGSSMRRRTHRAQPVGAALRVGGGAVVVEHVRFENNQAGAIAVHNGSLHVIESVFARNRAVRGGAVYMRGGHVQIASSLLEANSADESGGAIYVDGGHLRLSNETLILTNGSSPLAPKGSALHLTAHGMAEYELPAPLGRWVFAQEETASTLTPGSAIDSSYPFPCNAGIVGDSYQPRKQSSPLCARICGAGFFCAPATGSNSTPPRACPLGSWCEAGTPLPSPCAQGTYGAREGLKSQAQCMECPKGSYCERGARVDCGLSAYNPLTRATRQEDCVPCPDNSRSLFFGSTSRDDCLCVPGYYVSSNRTAGCNKCPVGAACIDLGQTLEELPIRKGFYRISNGSDDVQQCQDALYNCSGASGGECAHSASSCTGGADHEARCAAGTTGVFCLRCESWDLESVGREYYVATTHDAPAHCKRCDAHFLAVYGLPIYGGATAVLLALAVLAVRWKCRSAVVAPLSRLAKSPVLASLGLSTKLRILYGFYAVVSKVHVVYDITLPARVMSLVETISVPISLGLAGLDAPFACLGLNTFRSRLTFWMVTPALVVALLALYSCFEMWRHHRRELRPSTLAHLVSLHALPSVLKVLFFFYPQVSTVAFQAFACYHLSDGESADGGGATLSFLRADVSVACDSPAHASVAQQAWVGVAVYPIGVLSFNALLLFSARRAIMAHPPTRFARVLSFLYKDFKPEFFWWLLVENFASFLLIGLFVHDAFSPGSMQQILTALLVEAVLLVWMGTMAMPYKEYSDMFMSASCNMCLFLYTLCCLLFKFDQLVEQAQAGEILSAQSSRMFVLDMGTVAAVALASMGGGLLSAAALVTLDVIAEQRRQAREAAIARARRLHYVKSDKLVASPVVQPSHFHLFLSHVWSTGQDQMRLTKTRLLGMVPDLVVFLDVDDLEEGRGQEYVDRSETVLIFVSDGYFVSVNCMREFLRAVFDGKPLCALLESEKNKGGMTYDDVCSQMQDAESMFKRWGLLVEAAEWGFEVPPAQALTDLLFAQPALEWNRLPAFQDTTLRLVHCRLPLIALDLWAMATLIPCLALPCLEFRCVALPRLLLRCVRLPCVALLCRAFPSLAFPRLPSPCLALPCLALPRRALPRLALRGIPSPWPTSLSQRKSGGGETRPPQVAERCLGGTPTYLPSDPSRIPSPVMPLLEGQRFHLYVSPHNRGAVEFVDELQSAQARASGKLKKTSQTGAFHGTMALAAGCPGVGCRAGASRSHVGGERRSRVGGRMSQIRPMLPSYTKSLSELDDCAWMLVYLTGEPRRLTRCRQSLLSSLLHVLPLLSWSLAPLVCLLQALSQPLPLSLSCYSLTLSLSC